MGKATLCVVTVCGCVSLAMGQSLIGVDFDNGAGSPNNWNTVTSAGPFSIGNLIDESGALSGVGFSINSNSTFTTAATGSTLPQHSQSLAGLDDYMFGTGAATATFSGLNPGQGYFVWAFGLRGFSMGNDVSIIGGGPAVSFDQDDDTPGNLWVNGELGSDARTLQSFAAVQTADSAGQISIRILDDLDAGGTGWTSAGLAIQVVPAPGGVALLGLGGLLAVRRRR